MIEPARFGRPCISTKAGALGSTLETTQYVHAETAEDWLKAIESLNMAECLSVGLAARGQLKDIFDEKAIATKFATKLDQLLRKLPT